ncbi:MAG: 23S rRNA (uracil(1939)-C(5))-methyltransferase RlmD [Chromatiales bacterium]|mgnify:CR=1 FL=1|jgi:23S rRNA (uracil1939-C5)-methyltransferase
MGRRRGKKRLPEGEFSAMVESLSHDGRGVTHIDGKAVFIHGALPGERVLFNYSHIGRTHDEGVVREILEPSDDRVVPICEHFGICGGCSLQHMRSDRQIGFKQQSLIDALNRIGKVRPDHIEPPITSHPSGYRKKARLGVKYVAAKQKVLIGFRERGSSFITDIDHCPVLHPAVGENLRPLAELIGTFSIRDRIPQIELAVGDDGIILIFRLLDSLLPDEAERLVALCERYHWTPYVQEAGPDSVRPLADQLQLFYELPDEMLRFDFLPTDFTQVNTGVNRMMIAQAMEWLRPSPDETILDLFCGLGNFTLPLARRARQVTGVEGDVALVRRAMENMEKNGIGNVSFHVANLYESLEHAGWARQHYDAVLLDPPRSGALEIMPLIEATGASRVLYVSCYPGTLARDAGELVNRHGYRMVRAGVMDMFPHTAHVESMALFER